MQASVDPMHQCPVFCLGACLFSLWVAAAFCLLASIPNCCTNSSLKDWLHVGLSLDCCIVYQHNQLLSGRMQYHCFMACFSSISGCVVAVRLYDRRMSLQRGHNQFPSGRSWPQWVSCFIPTSLKTDTMQPRTGTERCCSCCTDCWHEARSAVVMLRSIGQLVVVLVMHFADVTGLLQSPVLTILKGFACTSQPIMLLDGSVAGSN